MRRILSNEKLKELKRISYLTTSTKALQVPRSELTQFICNLKIKVFLNDCLSITEALAFYTIYDEF